MRFVLSKLAVTAGLLVSSSNALSLHNAVADLPVSALLTSAQSHLARGETNEALVYYDAAISRDPQNYLTRFKRATTYLSLGRTAQAIDDFHEVLALRPGFEGAHLQLARLKSKLADWEAAKAEYKAAKRGSESPDVLELTEAEAASKLAEEAARSSHWDECVSQASVAIVVASRSSSLRQLRAHCRFERAEIEEGMGDLHHVLQMRPGDTSPHVLISATSFYGLSDFPNGLAQVRKCLHFDPESKVCKRLFKTQKLIQTAFARAETQLSKGQFTTAARLLVGNDDEPGLIVTVREQVEELRQHGRIPPKARARLYEKVVEMVCQAYSESNHREAEKFCDDALHLDPGSFWALINRGRMLIKKEEFQSAIEALKKAADARPDQQEKVNSILHKAQLALKRSKTKDYYKILGVARNAVKNDIKAAYRRASKQHHPDKAAKQGISKEDAEKKMAAINEAYEVLSDPELRGRFDNGDDPNSHERPNPFQGSPFDGSHPFHMFHQQDGSTQAKFKFQFGGGGAGPFGF